MLRQILLCIFVFAVSDQALPQNIKRITKLFYQHEEKRLAYAEMLQTHYLDNARDSLFPIASFLIDEGIKKERKDWLFYGKYLICYCYNGENKLNYSYSNLAACKTYYESKRDKETQAKVLDLLGQTCFLDLRYSEAIDYFVESMQKHRESSSDYFLSGAQFNLANTFYAIERYESAEKEIESFITQAKKEELRDACSKGYNLLGKIYLATNRKEEANEIWEKSMKLAQQIKSKKNLASNYNLMGIAYAENGELEKAKDFFKRALDLRLKSKNSKQICESAFNLGELCFLTGNFNEAIAYYQQELDWADRFGLLTEKADALEAISYAWAELKQYEKAFDFATQFAEQQDSLLARTQLRDQGLDEQFNDHEKLSDGLIQRQRERILEERIKEERKITYWLFALSIVLILVLFWLFNRKISSVSPENGGEI